MKYLRRFNENNTVEKLTQLVDDIMLEFEDDESVRMYSVDFLNGILSLIIVYNTGDFDENNTEQRILDKFRRRFSNVYSKQGLLNMIYIDSNSYLGSGIKEAKELSEYDRFRRIIDDIMLEYIDDCKIDSYQIVKTNFEYDFKLDIYCKPSDTNEQKQLILKDIKSKFARRFDHVVLSGPFIFIDTRFYKSDLRKDDKIISESIDISRYVNLVDDIILKYVDSDKISNYKIKQAENQPNKILLIVTYPGGNISSDKTVKTGKEILSDLERRFNDVHSTTSAFIINTLNYKKDISLEGVDVEKMISLVNDIMLEFVDDGKVATYDIKNPKERFNTLKIDITYSDYKERNGYDILSIRDDIVSKLRRRFEYMDYNLYSIELFMNTYKNKKST